jgi:hypothetical protein
VTERRKAEINRKCQITRMLIADDVGWSGQHGEGVQELAARAENVRDPHRAGGVIRDASGADHVRVVKAREYVNTLVVQQFGPEYAEKLRIGAAPGPLPFRKTLLIVDPAPAPASTVTTLG